MKRTLLKGIWVLTVLVAGAGLHSHAQLTERLCLTDYRLDPQKSGGAYLEIDNISFFKNNEYKAPVTKGYTLPGFWIEPCLSYYPLKNIKLEAGIHALIYHGTCKFPNYAYQDIAYWKGEQYQKGAHVLPYFRAQLQLKNINLVWGNLYGGSNHRLVTPLYTPELNLTADPETGLQLLWDAPRLHFDLWVNWQSFIFKQDTHQEAFTVGLSTETSLSPRHARTYWYMPFQLLAQHRGGEIDLLTESSVQTLCNGAIGIGMKWRADRRILKQVDWEADLLGYYQQKGELWPYDQGAAAYLQGGVNLGEYVRLTGGGFYGKKFISLFGLPYFGTVSTTYQGSGMEHTTTAFATAEYSRTFKKMFAMGVRAEIYHSMSGDLTKADGSVESTAGATNLAVGAYFRVNLDFRLWKH